MQSKNVVVMCIAFIILLGISVWMFKNYRNDSIKTDNAVVLKSPSEALPTNTKDTKMNTSFDGMEKPTATTTMMQKNGSYELYSPEKIAKANSGDVVLFFKAGWCPTCRALDADIKAHMSAISGNLTILEVDYDNSTALKQKYGVTTQHTLVQVDGNGNVIKKWSGSPTLAGLVAEVQ